MNIACIFPGQGSQSLGMLSELSQRFPIVRETFDETSDILGIDFWSIVTHGPEHDLNTTSNTQPIMLAAGVAVWRVWTSQHGAHPAVMAGHSFGEYTALVGAGALEFRDAVPLARLRGQLMQSAVPEGEGAMAAILGLGDQQVSELCTQAAQDQVVSPANFNSPVQIVIAGHREAVERTLALASKAGAKRTLRLAVSVPAHCNLMAPAARVLSEQLTQTQIRSPTIPVLHNADVKSHKRPSDIRDALVQQLCSPVRWTQTVQQMKAQGITTVLELGPGKVLTGLNKRIDRSLTALCVQDSNSYEQAMQRCGEVS